MNYLSVENLSKTFGEKELFSNLTFGLEMGEKAALVARNGTGKTTLLKIIMGQVLPDSGSVTVHKGIRVDFLPQNPVFDLEQTVEEFVLSGSRPEGTESWEHEQKVKEVLYRLRITRLEQKMSELSGGQRKKAALARVLLENADLLLLDEPTNHLDMEMTEWLEDFLRRQKLSLLLVTHDRAFLDNVCSRIYEIDKGEMYTYRGNYSYFLEKKAEREAVARSEVEKARNIYRRELEWMRSTPSARGTKARARKEAFEEVKEKALRRTDEQVPELSVLGRRLGNKILEVYNLGKSYEGHKVLDDFSYIFKRGDKIGVVGPNGVGKSTFLDMITGRVRPDAGRVTVGETIAFGYYTQGGLDECEDKRVIDIVKEVAEVVKMQDGSEISASQFLQYFQFDATAQYNYFSNLSGGERRRLYLLRTLMANPNFLILDEPTNDLDVYTLMLLEDFLSHFQGCLLIVSHDRTFLNHLADHLFVFEGEGKVKDWYGTYAEYKAKKAEELRQQQLSRRDGKSLVEASQANRPSATASKPRASFKQKKEYEALSARIAALEAEKTELESLMGGTETDPGKIAAASARYQTLQEELSAAEDCWLELSLLIEG